MSLANMRNLCWDCKTPIPLGLQLICDACKAKRQQDDGHQVEPPMAPGELIVWCPYCGGYDEVWPELPSGLQAELSS